MEDKLFKSKNYAGRFLKQSSQDDIIEVKVEYSKELKNGEEITKEPIIKEVYSLNGEKQREKPNDFVINKPQKIMPNEVQLGLFAQQKREVNHEN